jgi:hypothetical protein
MSPSSPSSHWQQAFSLAESLPYHFTRMAKHRAISDLLQTLHQALLAGRP